MCVEKWYDSIEMWLGTTKIVKQFTSLRCVFKEEVESGGGGFLHIYYTYYVKDFLYCSFPNGTLVNHESWENVVQSAHVMAKILNRTEFNSTKLNNDTVSYKNETAMSKKK